MGMLKIPNFHLTSLCGNFVERHCFYRVWGDSRKLGETLVFYTVARFEKKYQIRNWKFFQDFMNVLPLTRNAPKIVEFFSLRKVYWNRKFCKVYQLFISINILTATGRKSSQVFFTPTSSANAEFKTNMVAKESKRSFI